MLEWKEIYKDKRRNDNIERRKGSNKKKEKIRN